MAKPHEFPMLPAEGAAPPVAPAPIAPPQLKRSGPDPRQTLSYLRNLLQNYGIEPKNKLGQNFLIDLNLIDLVVRAAELSLADSVLEVGTGTGSLTSKLADSAGAVCTCEIDREFYKLAQNVIGKRPNVFAFLGDALERKNELNPDLLDAWAEISKKFGTTKRKLIANLPYAVATPIISNLLLIPDFPIDRMVVMVQWEIGERLRAEVGTKDYNSLSVLVQSVADVEIIRKVAPTNFFPKPKVDSAIVQIVPNPEKRKLVGDVAKFRTFLRDLYCHRRKNLRQALTGWPSGRRDKVVVDAKLAELGINGSLRSEALSVHDHLRLANAFE